MAVISQTAFGKIVGVSQQAVGKAIKSGRLKDSLVTVNNQAAPMINEEVGVLEWEKKTQKLKRKLADAKEKVEKDSKTNQVYTQSRSLRESYQARLAKLDYEQRSGKLVDSDEVRESGFKVARAVRDSLMNVPDRIDAILAAETDRHSVHTILTKAIMEALERLDVEFKK